LRHEDESPPAASAAGSAPALTRVRAYILRMAGLSTTAMKVLRTCNDPHVCANSLNRVISLDPVLTGRVLQLINSAYYGLPGKVSSLTRAIILLGINPVKNLVLSFAVIESFSRRDAYRVFSADGFWAHSLSTAVASKLLAAERGIPVSEREEFFVAGLMHDIGKIPLNHLFPEEYRHACRLAEESGVGARSGEESAIGVDHCRVGAMIAQKWELSAELRDALGGHHEPRAAAGAELLDAVALADALAHETGAGMPGGPSLDAGRRGGLKALWRLDPEAAARLREAVAVEIEKARVFLEVASGR
jgi:putative nucleotidyltransferase with HDIG domain